MPTTPTHEAADTFRALLEERRRQLGPDGQLVDPPDGFVEHVVAIAEHLHREDRQRFLEVTADSWRDAVAIVWESSAALP